MVSEFQAALLNFVRVGAAEDVDVPAKAEPAPVGDRAAVVEAVDHDDEEGHVEDEEAEHRQPEEAPGSGGRRRSLGWPPGGIACGRRAVDGPRRGEPTEWLCALWQSGQEDL